MKYVTLNNGIKMPQLGLGTFNVPDDDTAAFAVSTALKDGYRLIDTAHAYKVERGVGRGIKDSGVAREEIFLTSKIWPSEYGEGVTLPAIDKMLDRLGVEYIDLLLLHQPFGDVVGAWKDAEKAVKLGKVRSIGISNFEQYHYDDILAAAEIKPAVLQIECHPYYQQRAMREKAARDGIAVESWFPLGGRPGDGIDKLFADETIKSIAAAHGKTVAQTILRWHLQEGLIAIPGSVKADHIAEDLGALDFELSDDDIARIRALDTPNRFFASFEGVPYEQVESMLTGMQLD